MWQQGKNIPVTALRNTDVFSSLMKNGVRVCSELITLLILERRLYRFISVTSRGLSGPIYNGRGLEDEKLKKKLKAPPPGALVGKGCKHSGSSRPYSNKIQSNVSLKASIIMKSHLVYPEWSRRGAGVEVMWRNLPFNNFHFSKVCNSHVFTNDVSQTLKSVGNCSHPSYDCSSPVLWGWRTWVKIPLV